MEDRLVVEATTKESCKFVDPHDISDLLAFVLRLLWFMDEGVNEHDLVPTVEVDSCWSSDLQRSWVSLLSTSTLEAGMHWKGLDPLLTPLNSLDFRRRIII